MRRMSNEILSTVRPSGLRLAGFACLAAGAVVAGVGSTVIWMTVGFPGDTAGAADVPVHGTDVWEGKVVLFAVVAALLAMIAMRLAGSRSTRRWIALLLIALGVVCTVLPLLDALRAEERFGGGAGLVRVAASLAARLQLPEDQVRAQLEQQFARNLRVDVEPGVWVTAAGGVLLVAGGVLSLRWSRGAPAGEAEVETAAEEP
jgi:hypothetical protein